MMVGRSTLCSNSLYKAEWNCGGRLAELLYHSLIFPIMIKIGNFS